MSLSEHHTDRARTLLQRPSGVLHPPMSVSPVQSAHSVSLDLTAVSQDSPAHIGSFATTLFGTSDTSVITVPPTPPQQSPLQLPCNGDVGSIWPPQRGPPMFQGLSLAHVDSMAETEIMPRSFSSRKEEEEVDVEDLLDGLGSLSADLAELSVVPGPRVMKESATEEYPDGLNSSPIIIDSLRGRRSASLARNSFYGEAAVEVPSPTTAAMTERPRRGKGPLAARPNTPQSLQGTALLSRTLERRGATGVLQSVGAEDVTKGYLLLSPTRVEPSTSSSTLQRTSTSTSRRLAADTVVAKLPLQSRPPQHTQSPPHFFVSSCCRDTPAHFTQTSHAALGTKKIPPVALFTEVDSSKASTADISLQDFRKVGSALQALCRQSIESSESSPVAAHVDNESSRLLSPNVRSLSARAINTGELAPVQSLPHASRLASSGFRPLALPSASVALPSSPEEGRPSLSAAYTPITDRSSPQKMSSSSPRPLCSTCFDSTALSTGASPHYSISPTALKPLAATPPAQHFSAGAMRTLRNRQHGVRSPLEAIWLRSEGLLAPSELMLSAEECNKVNSPILNASSHPLVVAARGAGALLGSSLRRKSHLNVHELSSSMLSQEISTVGSGASVVPRNDVPPMVPQPVRERERRSTMQRIFREPKKGGQRVWVSITAPESNFRPSDTGEKS
ncbi:hypothetical protein, unknown function [Leishmania tarentolae]|uniref:Uncharacterized protein n=1 Tax=Leishmania tarentolae TaxID=5689 RepID=A0A640KPT0_LEITA|nr:hypothetical protein, unknown function [Leishmania tarentolae]